jgi:hypothetical protein
MNIRSKWIKIAVALSLVLGIGLAALLTVKRARRKEKIVTIWRDQATATIAMTDEEVAATGKLFELNAPGGAAFDGTTSIPVFAPHQKQALSDYAKEMKSREWKVIVCEKSPDTNSVVHCQEF